MGQGGKRDGGSRGYLTVKEKQQSLMVWKSQLQGFQKEKGKLLCLGMLKIHEVMQKGAVVKTWGAEGGVKWKEGQIVSWGGSRGQLGKDVRRTLRE